MQEDAARGVAAAPNTAAHAAVASGPNDRSTVDDIALAGIHSAPEATWRRLQSPQPTPRGVLAGVV
jgi:hypothetical protein